MLVQYAHALPLSKKRVFVEFGPSISHIGGGQSTIYSTSTQPSSPTASSTTSNVSSYSGQGVTQAGVTFGGGIDVTLFHLHLRPQFRYSHWFSTASQAPILGVGPTVLNANSAVISVAVSTTGFTGFLTQPDEASFLLDLLF